LSVRTEADFASYCNAPSMLPSQYYLPLTMRARWPHVLANQNHVFRPACSQDRRGRRSAWGVGPRLPRPPRSCEHSLGSPCVLQATWSHEQAVLGAGVECLRYCSAVSFTDCLSNSAYYNLAYYNLACHNLACDNSACDNSACDIRYATT
jgi:hypothetical protein